MERALHCEIADVSAVDDATRAAMFDLYERYYSGARRPAFERDLADKSQVLLLRNAAGAVSGFSTVKSWVASVGTMRLRVIYSGDTVIDRTHWGTQALPFRWLENAGAIKAMDPRTPLYWLLITKGHRTYRYMSAFARTFYPTWRAETPPQMQLLMETVGHQTFGDRFDRAAGIVRHDQDGAALRGEHAGLDGRQAANREIAFFTQRNPGHGDGDELLCMCELSEDNLRPMARKQFLRGHDNAELDTSERRRQA